MPDGVPNYLTTNADGTVAAEFSGGVAILAQPLPPSISNRKVTWHKDTISGPVIFDIAGIENGSGGGAGSMQVKTTDGTRTAEINFAADAGGGASISVSASQPGKAPGYALLNSDGTSPVMRSRGRGTATFSGSNASNTITVNHGLNVTPEAVVATSATGFGVSFYIITVGPTNFTIAGGYPYGTLNQTIDFFWAAG